MSKNKSTGSENEKFDKIDLTWNKAKPLGFLAFVALVWLVVATSVSPVVKVTVVFVALVVAGVMVIIYRTGLAQSRYELKYRNLADGGEGLTVEQEIAYAELVKRFPKK